MFIKKSTLLIYLLTVFAAIGYAKVVEVPFVELPTGQMAIQVEMSGLKGQHFFILESAGSNMIRNDMNYRLNAMGMDTTKGFQTIDTVFIGEMPFTENNNFKMRRKLGKRGEYAFPPTVLGTIGPGLFKNKCFQVDYQKHIFRMADNIDELKASNKVQRVAFAASFTNNVPVIEITTVNFGNQDAYVEYSMPLGFNFYWGSVPKSVQSKYTSTFEVVQTSFDGGKSTFQLYTHKVGELYINRTITINNIDATFSNGAIAGFGNLFLKHFVSTFDFKNGYFYLDPVTEMGKQLLAPIDPKRKKKKAPKHMIGISN